MTDSRRLHWGKSSIHAVGWIYAAAEEAPGIAICCDIVLEGLPLAANSLDYIVSQHALQQLEVYYLWPALAELYAVLRPGGVLRLAISDLDLLLEAYQRSERDVLWCWDWDTLSGNVITQLVNYNLTRTPLSYAFVAELLAKVGFAAVRRVAYQQTTSRYPAITELDCRPHESVYIEASKPLAQQATAALPGPPSQIHLSWTHDPSTSLTILWHTPIGNGSPQVEYRPVGAEQWQHASATTRPAPGGDTLHQATLNDLLPDSAYEYRVSADLGAQPPVSQTFQTRTAPPPGSADLRFAFVCDTGLVGREDGNATGTAAVIEQLVADKPLFVLGGGDYAYANRDRRYKEVASAIDAWFAQMQPLIAQVPLMAQYGNHEIALTERFRDWSPRFAHPAGFDNNKNYSFDLADMHIAALFIPDARLLRLEQLRWLDDDLRQARQRGMRWLIVFQHEPVYGHGHSHPASPALRQQLCPLLEQHQVDLHLSGHDQNYERSYPLLGVPYNPTPTSTSLARYQAGQGVIYAKISPGGKRSEIGHDFSRFSSEQQPFIARRDDTAHHYALLTLRSHGELLVEVFQVAGNGTPRVLYDSFCIVQA